MARQTTIKAFEQWKLVPENVDGFFALLEGDEKLTFRNATVAIKQPYTLMWRLVNDSEELKARYDSILAARGDRLAQERLEIADGVKPDRDEVAKARLQVDVRDSLASKWNRERYGETIRVERDVRVGVDVTLRGRASELLARIAGRAPVLIENEATAVRPDALECKPKTG
jgi:hypothetical protein